MIREVSPKAAPGSGAVDAEVDGEGRPAGLGRGPAGGQGLVDALEVLDPVDLDPRAELEGQGYLLRGLAGAA